MTTVLATKPNPSVPSAVSATQDIPLKQIQESPKLWQEIRISRRRQAGTKSTRQNSSLKCELSELIENERKTRREGMPQRQ
jgi:hypothetical protein